MGIEVEIEVKLKISNFSSFLNALRFKEALVFLFCLSCSSVCQAAQEAPFLNNDGICLGKNCYNSFTPVLFDSVVSGDVFIAGGREIRLWGINAPENGELGDQSSGWLLNSLISQAKLACKLIEIDARKQYVMHCYADGLDVGSFMVRMGMAMDYESQSMGFYGEDEAYARKNKIGLWKYR